MMNQLAFFYEAGQLREVVHRHLPPPYTSVCCPLCLSPCVTLANLFAHKFNVSINSWGGLMNKQPKYPLTGQKGQLLSVACDTLGITCYRRRVSSIQSLDIDQQDLPSRFCPMGTSHSGCPSSLLTPHPRLSSPGFFSNSSAMLSSYASSALLGANQPRGLPVPFSTCMFWSVLSLSMLF